MTLKFSGILELRVNSGFLRLYSVPPPTIANDILISASIPTETSICLLRGRLKEFVKYSRSEASKWLIDIAHDICDPADQRGSLLVWKEAQQQWCTVDTTESLTASIYRYDLPDGITVGLSKTSQRNGTSVTSITENPSTMDDRVKSRDERCWATPVMSVGAMNSHIIPKRIGDQAARVIFSTFTSLTASPTLSIYDEIFGLTLSRSLDWYFKHYLMGLRYVSENLYECHSFLDEADGHATTEGPMLAPGMGTPIHGLAARPPHPEGNNVPPPGLFRWHYLQCVIKKFGHDDYKTLENIDHYELPLRMRGDSENEGSDNEAEWPSMTLDLDRVAKRILEENVERRRVVEAWVSNA